MDTYKYTCGYCGKDYIPKRRKVQKYCSASCRTRACNLRKEAKKNKLEKQKTTKSETSKNKVEQMSLAGIGNAVAGTLAVNGLSSLFTKEENKPATKKDIKEIKNLLLERYHLIRNMNRDIYGNQPYFDIDTNTIVYFKK